MQVMHIQNILGRNVRLRRKQLGWSQERLAEESGLHRTYISGLELGQRNITLAVVAELASALGVPAARLFDAGGHQE